METGEVIGLVENRTLPIRFRIEEGALGITIDATALSSPIFFLGGPHPFPTQNPSDTPLLLDLEPGTYTVRDGSGGIHEFEVTATGDVAYAPEKEPYFDGTGTSQLTVVGYNVDIDATALVSSVFSLGGIGSLPTTVMHTINSLPGDKTFSPTDVTFDYEVREDGLLDYEASLDLILSGRSTNILTISP